MYICLVHAAEPLHILFIWEQQTVQYLCVWDIVLTWVQVWRLQEQIPDIRMFDPNYLHCGVKKILYSNWLLPIN